MELGEDEYKVVVSQPPAAKARAGLGSSVDDLVSRIDSKIGVVLLDWDTAATRSWEGLCLRRAASASTTGALRGRFVWRRRKGMTETKELTMVATRGGKRVKCVMLLSLVLMTHSHSAGYSHYA